MNIFQIKQKIDYIPLGFSKNKFLIYNKKLELTNIFFIIRSFVKRDITYRIDYIDPSQLNEHLLMLRLHKSIYFLGSILSHLNVLTYYIFDIEKDIKYFYYEFMNIIPIIKASYPNYNDKNIDSIINEFKEKICNSYLFLTKL